MSFYLIIQIIKYENIFFHPQNYLNQILICLYLVLLTLWKSNYFLISILMLPKDNNKITEIFKLLKKKEVILNQF